MELFDRLYNASEELKKTVKKPFVYKKITRALDGAVDSYETQKIDTQELVDKLMEKLANGDTGVIADLIENRLALIEIETQAKEAAKIKAELDSAVE